MSILAYVPTDSMDFVPPQLPTDTFQLADGADRTAKAKQKGPADVAAIVPINSIGGRELRRTLVVSVEWEDGEVIVSHVGLRVWGIGKDPYAAARDFWRTLHEVADSYAATPEPEMTAGAKAYLDELRSYLPNE